MCVQDFAHTTKIKLFIFLLDAFYLIMRPCVFQVHFGMTKFILRPIEIVKLHFNGIFLLKSEMHL